jgi:hypothetical protein
MPKKLATPPKSEKIGLKEMIVGGGAALGFVAALISNYQNIIDFVFRPDNVKVGWLSVGDPATLQKCIFVNGSNIFKLSGGREVQLANTPCLTELRALLSDATQNAEIQEQKINSSYFLLVENQGQQIDQLRIKPTDSNSDQDMIFRDVNKGASIAICMGYDGNAGTPSKMNSVVEIEVKRNATREFDVNVPKKTHGTPIAVSDCGPIVWNYPD